RAQTYSLRPTQHLPFETAPGVEDGATRRSAAARNLVVGVTGTLPLRDLLFDRAQMRQKFLAENVVVNLLRCGESGSHVAQRDLALGACQGCARDRPLIVSKSQGGHAPYDDPCVGMQVVERSLSFFASGNAPTGFLQHSGAGAVVVEGWKVSLKPRRER